MKLSVELDENEIRKILVDYIGERFNTSIAPSALPIEVKSKQNYRSEWESAAIRVKVDIPVKE